MSDDVLEISGEGAESGGSSDAVVSIEDTMSATFDRMQAQPADAEEKPAQSRDASGRFAKAAEQVAADPAQEEVGESPPDGEAAAKPDSLPKPRRAPGSWREDEHSAYDALPDTVKDIVDRREADYTRGIQKYSQDAKYGAALRAVIDPYANNHVGVDQATLVKSLLHADHVLRNGSPDEKRQAIDYLMTTYGIERAATQKDAQDAGRHEGQQAQVAPELQPVMEELERVKTWINQRETQQYVEAQQRARIEYDRKLAEVQEFASKPEHKHFDAVADLMMAFVRADKDITLDAAYERAIWAHPEVRQQLQAEQEAEKAEQARQAAEKAKRTASANVRRSGTPPAQTKRSTIDETMAAAYDRLNAA